jgi:hypothetical protein
MNSQECNQNCLPNKLLRQAPAALAGCGAIAVLAVILWCVHKDTHKDNEGYEWTRFSTLVGGT